MPAGFTSMSERNALHQLVDSLPKGALEAARTILQVSQTWRPKPRPDVPTMRQRVRENFAKDPSEQMSKHFAERAKHLAERGIDPSRARQGLDRLRGASWFTFEGETLVTFRMQRFDWQELEIEERFSLSEDKAKLRYAQEIQGPKVKKEHYTIDFECR